MEEWGRDPHTSGSGCGQPSRKLKIGGFKEGGFIPENIFLNNQIGIMVKSKNNVF